MTASNADGNTVDPGVADASLREDGTFWLGQVAAVGDMAAPGSGGPSDCVAANSPGPVDMAVSAGLADIEYPGNFNRYQPKCNI